MTTVLVTGVGAVTGYGVVRSLRARRPELRIVGIDSNDDAVGALWCDEFVVCPTTVDASYPGWLRATTRSMGVDLVLPTLDADLDLFQRSNTAEQIDSALALNSDAAIEVSRDKWQLDRLLVSHDEPARIPTSTSTDFDELRALLGLPFLLKPRRGYGSRGIVTVNHPEQLAERAPRLADELIAQKIVGDDDAEYTVGVFGDGGGRVCARIAMHRWLAPWGSTRRVEVIPVPAELDATIERLAAIVAPRGPTNLQLRRDGDAWLLLEVNARFSSSTSLRALFGYHEAEMTLDYFVHGRVPVQPEVRLGTATRYFEDVVTA